MPGPSSYKPQPALWFQRTEKYGEISPRVRLSGAKKEKTEESSHRVFSNHPKLETLRYPSVGEWIKCGISILVPLFGILLSNKKGQLMCATTWIEPKGVMLRGGKANLNMLLNNSIYMAFLKL